MNWNVFLLVISLILGVWPILTWIVMWCLSKRIFKLKYVFIISWLLSVGVMLASYIKNWDFQRVAQLISTSFGFFTLDASYDEFIECVNVVFTGWWSTIFCIEFCIYVFIMPLIGGYFLLNIIGEVLPSFKLWLNAKKTKYVFSELNDHSITLAEDLAEKIKQNTIRKRLPRFILSLFGHKSKYDDTDKEERKYLQSARIIFTDVYTDKESENSSELLMRAKNINAICIKDDIVETTFHWWWRGLCGFISKKIVYFLMDEKEENNSSSAITLMSIENNKVMKKVIRNKKYIIDMYVFTQSSESARLIDSKKERLIQTEGDRLKKKNWSKDKVNSTMNDVKSHMRIKCINEYRNIVYKMFDGAESNDKTLFDSLILSNYEKELESSQKGLASSHTYRVWERYFNDNVGNPNPVINVIILGAGRIAKEYFKAASWCFKMSSTGEDQKVDKVVINVFAKNASELKDQLLLETKDLFDADIDKKQNEDRGEEKQSSLGSNDLVTTDNKNEKDYDCEAHFYDVAFPSREFFEVFQKFTKLDENNSHIQKAQKILVALGDDRTNYDAARYIKSEFEREYGIGNDVNPLYIDFAIENNDLYNVLENEYIDSEKNKGGWCFLHPFSTVKDCYAYDCIRMDELEKRGLEADRIHDERDKVTSSSKYFSDNYKWKSSVAVALHTAYKALSKATINGNCESIYKLMCSNTINENEEERKKLADKIYWLEHRRWMAYYRSEGYRCPSAKEFALITFKTSKNGECKYNNKDVERRLHACMLKCDKDYIGIKNLLKKAGWNNGNNSADIVKENLKKEIEKLQKSNDNTMTLEEWLKNHILPKDKDIDNLDRLSLLITLFNEKDLSKVEESCDYKQYDVELGMGLILKAIKLRIEKLYYDIVRKNINFNEESSIQKELDNVVDMLLELEAIHDKDKKTGKAHKKYAYERVIIGKDLALVHPTNDSGKEWFAKHYKFKYKYNYNKEQWMITNNKKLVEPKSDKCL